LDTEAVRTVLGLTLACGRLERRRGPQKSSIYAVFEGGCGEKDFLGEKVAEFRCFIPTDAEIRDHLTAPREGGLRTPMLRFRATHASLRPIYNLMYPAGVRRITATALELLGGRAAAWWWAENARPLPSGEFLLKRVGSRESEAVAVAAWLRMLTGAEARHTNVGRRPKLVISAGDVFALQTTLLPYAPTSRRSLFVPEVP
jgi:hypothetical protein